MDEEIDAKHLREIRKIVGPLPRHMRTETEKAKQIYAEVSSFRFLLNFLVFTEPGVGKAGSRYGTLLGISSCEVGRIHPEGVTWNLFFSENYVAGRSC